MTMKTSNNSLKAAVPIKKSTALANQLRPKRRRFQRRNSRTPQMMMEASCRVVIAEEISAPKSQELFKPITTETIEALAILHGNYDTTCSIEKANETLSNLLQNYTVSPYREQSKQECVIDKTRTNRYQINDLQTHRSSSHPGNEKSNANMEYNSKLEEGRGHKAHVPPSASQQHNRTP